MAAYASLELEIRNLLLARASTRDIVDRLMARFSDPNFSPEDRRQTLAFAWNAGLYQHVIAHFPELLRTRKRIGWAWFAELVHKAKKSAGKEWTEALLKGARRQNDAADLTLCRSWDEKIPQIADWRKEVMRDRKEQMGRQRQVLFDKLAFFRNEQMAEEERRLLTLLRKMYPGDSEIDTLEAEFIERWARHVITKHSAGEHWLERTELLWDDAVLEAVRPLFDEIRGLVEARPALTYDFAVALLMMDLEQFACELLPAVAKDPATDWLRAEALLRSHRYVDCLDHLTGLEMRYGGYPETAFAITYLRAQSYWGLGQNSRGVELLQTLVAVRPHYRSAASLLKQWQEGRSG
jgi:hypothetical protein